MDELEKALEEIVRNFLLHETNGKSKKGGGDTKEGAHSSQKTPSSPVAVPDDEFMENLYQCLAERGILREVLSLLRQRLIEILKGSYPQVVSSGCDTNFSPAIAKLLEDFLCCHNMLFTFSVFATETGNSDSKPARNAFGKLSNYEAENTLMEISIPRSSPASRRILKEYSENHHVSLLECILDLTLQGTENEKDRPCRDSDTYPFLSKVHEQGISPLSATAKKLKSIDFEFAEKMSDNLASSRLEGVDDKIFHMQMTLERDKEAQIKIAMQRFKEEESAKIRDEVETQLKFQFLAKEKELLRNYDDRVAHMKSLLDREKETWNMEKARKEKELFSQRQDLVRLMEHVKEKKVKLKEALLKAQNQTPSNPSPEDRKLGDVSVKSDSTDISSDERNTLLKNIQLESALKRLQSENARLHNVIQKKHRTSEKAPNKNSSSTDDENQNYYMYEQPTRRAAGENDRLALLQYTVEKQYEEIENLKRRVKDPHAPQSPTYGEPFSSRKANIDSPFLRDTSLETFLAESKLRFAEIEKKADVMSTSLKEVFSRKSAAKRHYSNLGSASPPISPTSGRPVVPPAVPKMPSNLGKHSFKAPPTPLAVPIYTPGFTTQSGSFEPALKSFLLNEDEDMFTSSLKIPESSGCTQLLVDSLFPNVVKLNPSGDEFSESSSPLIPTRRQECKSKLPETDKATSSVPSKSESEQSQQPAPNTKNLEKKKNVEDSRNARNPIESNEDFIPPFLLAGMQAQAMENDDKTMKEVQDVEEPTPFGNNKNSSVEAVDNVNSASSASKFAEANADDKSNQERERATDPSSRKSQSALSDGVQKSQEFPGDLPFQSQRDERAIANDQQIADNARAISATASSSGALTQYKVPSPEVSQTVVPFKSISINEPQRSKEKKMGVPLSHDKNSLSSDNEISFPEISHAEGDTYEFMAEEDFWAI